MMLVMLRFRPRVVPLLAAIKKPRSLDSRTPEPDLALLVQSLIVFALARDRFLPTAEPRSHEHGLEFELSYRHP